MKTTIFCSALAVSLAASTGYGQSVEELLGLTVPGMQTPSIPTETGHTTAEESPFYLSFTVDPVIEGDIDLDDTSAPAGFPGLSGSQVKFDLGIGFGITFGWRIPDTYIILQISTGFLWNEVNKFNGSLQPTPGTYNALSGNDGNLYQIPVLLSPGLEFDLPGGWPFIHGGLIRFGPTIGMTYHDLSVSDIKRAGAPGETYSFGTETWVFAYGAFLSIDFFLSHNVALSFGYQFMGTSPIDYGGFEGVSAGGAPFPTRNQPDAKTNFTYTSIIRCGISIYF